MPGVLIIGYGNPLRGDDGVGWHAAQQLAQAVPSSTVHVLACHQLTPDLAAPLSGVDRVIFIDACVDDAAPHHRGTGPQLREQIIAAPSPHSLPAPGAFSHHLTPAALLACTHILYGAHPQAVVLTVSGTSFGYAEQVSAPVRAMIPALLARATALTNLATPLPAAESICRPVT